MKKIFFISILFPLLLSCKNDNGLRDITAYYFPLKKLKKGKVYEYLPTGNEHDPPMYWWYRSEKRDGRFFLTGTSYDPGFLPGQFVREEKLSNGMKLIEFYVYEKPDSASAKIKVKANIAAGNVFPFFVKQPANVLLTSLSWNLPGEKGAKINFLRNRQFDKDTTFVFNNKTLPAVRFHTIELVEHDAEGRLPLEYHGEEIYAKGIGLAGLKKNIAPDYQMAYRLAGIYAVEEFEKKFNVKLPPR